MTEEKYRKVKAFIIAFSILVFGLIFAFNVVNDSVYLYHLHGTKVLKVNKITNHVEILTIEEKIDVEANTRKIKKVYDRLEKRLNDMPSFEQFCNDVQDEDKCIKIYDLLCEDTLVSMPSFEQFIKDMTLK